jgi:hypothetical protein
MFGRSDSTSSDAYVEWGLRQKNNAELRRQYIADTRPLLDELGIDVPEDRWPSRTRGRAIRPTSLYHYVPSKAHLLSLILDRAISTALNQIEEYLEIEDPGERLVALLTNQML